MRAHATDRGHLLQDIVGNNFDFRRQKTSLFADALAGICWVPCVDKSTRKKKKQTRHMHNRDVSCTSSVELAYTVSVAPTSPRPPLSTTYRGQT